MSKYIANKFGFVDFWYYDFEEFELSDGNLLLRGTNGSGKSVTMQSFVPLLLDGNKSPRRLDPFGSTDRRIENYMLDDTRDERTSYLYIEFKKDNMYLSVGMGMKAVKNKPLDSWYFLITDGRRINKDIFLYKEVGERYSLTKRELQNRIGAGGYFTEYQTQYMAKINEYLFGYDDIESYEELLNLLIQIRAPKLSKEFKPNKVYDILKESLKLLSDDDLRPMSDSMENMDRLRNTQEELKRALFSSNGIKRYYDRYNKSILRDKAVNFKNQYNIVNEYEKDIKNIIKTILENEKLLTETTEELLNKREMLKMAQNKLSAYEDSDYLKLLKRLTESNINLKETTDLMFSNANKLAQQKQQLNTELSRVKTFQNTLEADESSLLKLSIFSEEYAALASFDDGVRFKEEAANENADFEFIKLSLKKYMDKIKAAIRSLEEYEKQSNLLSLQEEEKYKNEKEIENVQLDIRRWEEIIITTKEELKENFLKWNENNNVFKVADNEINLLFQKINLIEQSTDIVLIKEQLNTFYNNLAAVLKSQIFIKKEEEEGINIQIKNLFKEIENLKNSKDVEPLRAQGVVNNRERLKKENIPFIPLYKAIDFNKHISEEIKQKMESALYEMGILDALIIEEKFKKAALDFPVNCHDKYIFIEQNLLNHNISSVFNVEISKEETISKAKVMEVLSGIFLNENPIIYLDETGNYGLGVLRGKNDDTYQLKFIGELSRRRHRDKLIENYNKEIENYSESKKVIQNEIKEIEANNDKLKDENENSPSAKDVLEAYYSIESLIRTLKDLESKKLQIDKIFFEVKTNFENAKRAVTISCEGIQISKNVEAFKDAQENLEHYKNEIYEMQRVYDKISATKEMVLHARDTIDNLETVIDNIQYEISTATIKIKTIENQIKSLNEAIDKIDKDGLEEEINKCKRIEDSYPLEIEKLSNKFSVTKERLNNFNLEKERAEKTKTQEELKLQIYEKELEIERDREFVMPKIGTDSHKIATEIIKSIGEGLTKLTSDYYNELRDNFTKYIAELREYNLKFISTEDSGQQDENIIKFSARTVLVCNLWGKEVDFYQLPKKLSEDISSNEFLIKEKERDIFEEVLLNTISNKIKSKIYFSRKWVENINSIMELTDTGQRLQLSLKWVPKRADDENQLDIENLLYILEHKDTSTEADIKKLSLHFGSKIKAKIQENEEAGIVNNYQSIMREVLDYRQWYEFKLYFVKDNEKKKELTLSEFNRFSGGERAMAMYIPLFSAVNARYNNAREDCPRIVCMDEAFAGVDDENINKMFKILSQMRLEYVLNSQILWGDYPDVPNLNICNLIREPSDKFVVIEKYHWDGLRRTYVS